MGQPIDTIFKGLLDSWRWDCYVVPQHR